MKFIGLDYTIQYKPGRHNVVADALSRRDTPANQFIGNSHLSVLHLSSIVPVWEEEARKSYVGDALVEKLKLEFENEDGTDGDWQVPPGLVKKKNKFYIGESGEVRKRIMKELHSLAIGGHSGVQATYQRIKRTFYWPGMN